MALIMDGCPGAANLRTPTIEEKICPVCGSVIEIFSIDTSVTCDKCGFVAYNDTLTCVKWCKYAEKCVGTEIYNRIRAQMSEKEKQKDI